MLAVGVADAVDVAVAVEVEVVGVLVLVLVLAGVVVAVAAGVDDPDALFELVGVLAVAVAVAPVVLPAALVEVDIEQAVRSMASTRPPLSQINNFFVRFGPEAGRCGLGSLMFSIVLTSGAFALIHRVIVLPDSFMGVLPGLERPSSLWVARIRISWVWAEKYLKAQRFGAIC